MTGRPDLSRRIAEAIRTFPFDRHGMDEGGSPAWVPALAEHVAAALDGPAGPAHPRTARTPHARHRAGRCPMCDGDDTDQWLCDDCANAVRRMTPARRVPWVRYLRRPAGLPVQGSGYGQDQLLGGPQQR